MIWNTAIDFAFNFLNRICSLLGIGGTSPFGLLGDKILEIALHAVDAIATLTPYFKIVFFFLPMSNIAFIFEIIVLMWLVRVLVSLVKTIWQLLPVV